MATKIKNNSNSSMGFILSKYQFILGTTIGRKVFAAITGLFLVTFIIVHLLGNLLLYVGQDAFNAYAYALEKNRALLYTMEVILAGAFLKHIIAGIILTLKNRAARPYGYVKRKTLGQSGIFSRNMMYSGTIVFIFLVIHVRTFRFIEGPLIYSEAAGHQIRDLYTHVLSYFNMPVYAGFYILAMVFVGGHISHGLQSAFRSLGLSNKKIFGVLKALSVAAGILFGVAFASIPLYFGFIR